MEIKHLRIPFLAALALIVSGCVVEEGYLPNTTTSSGGNSYSQCQAEAAKRFPPKLVLYQEPGYIGDRWVKCGDGSGRLCPPASAAYYADQGFSYDYNATRRRAYFRRCLAG